MAKILNGFFNRRTKEDKKITAGGQATAPGSTIIRTQPHRFGLDLDQYKAAIRAAESWDYTQRARLYDMYEDAMLDTHMIGIVGKRKGAVTSCTIEFRRNGVPDERVNANIRSPWFNDFIEDTLDANMWGFSLMQFSLGKDGYVEYFNVPRKHVDPQLRLIKRYQTDITGVPFEEYSNLLLVRGRMRIGLLAACLPWTIRKNGSVGDWAQFSELFGMPIREYTYDGADEMARLRILRDAASQGAAQVYIHPEGTSLNLVEAGNKTGSADVYDKFIDRCNAELSKAVLGNTLTTESDENGTQALGTVHKKEEDSLTTADKKFVLNVLNFEMTDIFANLGIDTKGGEFVFVDADDTPKTEKALLFKSARELGLPIEDDYMYQELGIEKPANYEQLKKDEQQRRNEMAARLAAASKEGKEPATNRGSSFFGESPDYRALNW